MKNVLVLVGAAALGYGAYLLICGNKQKSDPTKGFEEKKPVDIPATMQLYPSQALERFNTSVKAIFAGAGSNDNIDSSNPVSGQNLVL